MAAEVVGMVEPFSKYSDFETMSLITVDSMRLDGVRCPLSLPVVATEYAPMDDNYYGIPVRAIKQ